MRWQDSITDAKNMNLGKLWEMVEGQGVLQSLLLQRVRHNWMIEQQQWWFYSQLFCFVFFFKKSSYCFPQWLYQFTFPLAMQEGSLFSTPSPALFACGFFFYYGLSNRCEVVSHCSFDLHFSHHFMGNRWGNSGNSGRLHVLGLQNHCKWWLQP